MANLTDADKVIRNDVGKTIASKLDDIADAIVQHGGGAESLGQLSDVDIDTTTLAEGQSIVYNETTQKFENGQVSTVGGLNDLNDVTIDDTSLEQGQELVYNGTEEVFENKTTRVELTQAEYNALANPLPNVDYYITDAPSMQGTSADLSYDGDTESVHDVVEEVKGDVADLYTNKADKAWEYIGKITNGDTGLDVSNKSEVLLVGFANNNTRYLSFVFPMAEIVGVATVIVIEGTGTNKYVGEIAVNNNYKISTTQYSISGWSSMYLKVYAR